MVRQPKVTIFHPLCGFCFIFFVLLSVGCTNAARKDAVEPERAAAAHTDEAAEVEGGDGSAADDELEVADEIKPERETKITAATLYQLLVAELSAQQGDYDVAIDNYLAVAKSIGDVEAVARAAQLAGQAQNNERALEAVELWVELQPDDPGAHQAYASVLLRVGRPAEAVEQFDKMITLISEDPQQAYATVTAHLIHLTDRSVAQSVMEKIIEKRRDQPEALFAYSNLLLRLAKFDLALTAIDDTLKLKPDWPSAIILKARALALGPGRQASIDYLKAAVEGSMEKNLEVGISYARMLTENRELAPALDEFIRLAKLAPRHVEINYLAGVLALQLEKDDVAEIYLKKVIKLGKRLYEANYYLGQIAESRKDYNEAINRYGTVKQGELYFNAQVRVVALLAESKKFENAREYVRSIRAANSKQELQLKLLEGDVLREAERYSEAKAYYTELLTEIPHETSVRYARALIAEKLGELDLVEQDLQTILKDEPKNAQVLNALGYTLADRTQRYQEALSYIQRAYELEPNDAAVMDSMGWVQYRLGNYNDAIEHLQKAVTIDEDPEIAAHFGEVLWVVGNKDKARKVWKDSLQKHPEHQILLEVMKKFSE